jgi:hypothetical protein
MNALSQIEHQVKATKASEISSNDPDKIDLRLLANAAKPLLELEMLITHPHLQGIEFVSKSVPYVREFGIDLRRKAQESLLGALKDKNQAVIATSLQVCIFLLILFTLLFAYFFLYIYMSYPDRLFIRYYRCFTTYNLCTK